MKKYLLFTLIIFFTIKGQSQNYHELLKEGNKWNVLQELYAVCDCGSVTTFSFTLSNDTLIENVNYKKLMCEIFSAEKNNEIVSNIVYAAAIREDIDNQTVYVRFPNQDELLLYNFNPQIGDTIFVDERSDMEKIVRYVKEIDVYNINGYSGKKISVCDTTFIIEYNRPGNYYYTKKWETFTDEWYEGIGSLKNLLALNYNNDFAIFYDYASLDGTKLLCFWNHDVLIYQDEWREECVYAYTVGIEDISDDKKIAIYQTPNNGELTIDSDLDISTIQIYNLSGNKITETTRKNINAANFPNGVYLIRVQLSDDMIYTKKWIKH